MISKAFGAALLVGAATLAMPAQAQQPLRFTMGDMAVKGKIPAGFCLPTGNDKLAADILAKGDPDNETLAMLIRCDQANKPEGVTYDYYLVKSPKGMPTGLKRAEFLAAMAKELALPAYNTGSLGDRALADAGDSVSDAVGTKVDLSGDIRPRGTDKVCVYLAGQIQVRTDAVNYPIAMGGCGTTVGGRMLFVYSYDTPTKPDAVATQLRRARALADTLAAVDGRAN